MLNPKLFDENMELVSMRDGFAEGLVKAGEEDGNLIVVCADLIKSIKINKFAEKFPDRIIEVGVAEQNLVTVASGIASCGKNVFAASYAIFSPGRNWEQIRTTICVNNQPVKLVGSHAGITTGADGVTHQVLEDLALMRVLPNMVVLSPCDYLETKKATLAMAKLNKPCYIRFPRSEVPVITSENSPFEIGKAQILREGQHVSIIATGEMVYFALLAARELEMSNISARVINMSTIKPLDTKVIQLAAEDTGAIVTVEDHQIAGGLGSAVAEYLSENFPVPIKMVGMKDKFGESGTPEELMQKYGLTVPEIIKAVTTVLRLK
ncbi:MAG: transketolase family protein [Candidatus Daviesbacteria bacterium]|nr:transketolase family protein [Candidatus Daviesbacteria bacterium]